MLSSTRGNRLTSEWRCPHCGTGITTRTFRLDPANASRLLCPNRLCGKAFEWKQQNRGKLWPEQRAYNVLR